MTMLMLLAFLIDQVQQLCCPLYQKARQRAGTFSELFIRARTLIAFCLEEFSSVMDIY